MYAVRRWDEEVVKWLAVAMCIAMVGMAVMPLMVNFGDVGFVLMTYGGSKGYRYMATAGATLLRLGLAMPTIPVSPGMVIGKAALIV